MVCLNQMLHFASFIVLALKVRSQDVYYITSTLTECFPVTTAADTLSADPAHDTNPTVVISEPTINDPLNSIYPPLPPTDSDGPDGWRPPATVTYSMPVPPSAYSRRCFRALAQMAQRNAPISSQRPTLGCPRCRTPRHQHLYPTGSQQQSRLAQIMEHSLSRRQE